MFVFLFSFLTLIVFLGPELTFAECSASSGNFREPYEVRIQGYDDDAMEPFISGDNHYLFFNNRNDPPEKTDLHFAERVGSGFVYRGKVRGVNSETMDAVASIDLKNRFYFVSLRNFIATKETLFSGVLKAESVLDISPIAGIKAQPGDILFDLEVSTDGETLYYANGTFNGGGFPTQAKIFAASRVGNSFEQNREKTQLLDSINSGRRQYAPAFSRDELEVFFTRLDPFFLIPEPQIYYAIRASTKAPFGEPKLVEALKGFVEAPTLSADGCEIFYHTLQEGKYKIYSGRR